MEKRYYEAYDDRYRQVHGENLQWFMDGPSPIVGEVMERFGIGKDSSILEIGCGEGRDGAFLMARGYDVLATDVSEAAIRYARKKFPAFSRRFGVLDCLKGSLTEKYDFIYAVAVVHMLVEDEDRAGFYRFLRNHLAPGGVALIGTMGNGETERRTDVSGAFRLQERIHEQSGRRVKIAATSCRMVGWPSLRRELTENGLRLAEWGMTAIEPDFPQMMYAVVKKESENL